MFNLVAKEVTFWTSHAVPAEPHQERVPFVMLFRPLQVRNFNWIEAYGDEYDV